MQFMSKIIFLKGIKYKKDIRNRCVTLKDWILISASQRFIVKKKGLSAKSQRFNSI
jgi:hypothetical protein